jgi:hypothetical protein
MENKEVKIQKIPLDALIETLVSLYNQGIDYIDISGKPGTDFDSMAIVFTKDYMTEEGKKNFIEDDDNEIDLEIGPSKLTDDDINQLI